MRLPQVTVLSESEVRAIDEAAVGLLGDVGLSMGSQKARDILREAGADVHDEIVRFPERLVRNAVESAPRHFDIHDRRGSATSTLGQSQPLVASGHNAVYVLDSAHGDRRPSTKDDIGRFARLSDALGEIDVVGIQAMPQDVPPRSSLLHAADACWRNSTKHLYFSPDAPDVAEAIIDMAEAVSAATVSETRNVICQLSPTSPLFWEAGAVEALMITAERGCPCCFLPEPFSGVTSPITLAGLITMNVAETLGGLTLQQSIQPGAPAVFGSAWTTFDMRAANVLIAAPEPVLCRLAGAQMGRFYGLPTHSIGFDSDNHCYDEQMGMEKLATTFAPLAAGIDLVVNAGMFATGLTVSLAQLVADAETAGYLRRILRGIEVSEETIGLDAVRRVGPRGNFMTDEHTLAHLRGGEHWEPSILCRERYENWCDRARADLLETADVRARQLLHEHSVEPLPEKTAAELDGIIARFEAKL